MWATLIGTLVHQPLESNRNVVTYTDTNMHCYMVDKVQMYIKTVNPKIKRICGIGSIINSYYSEKDTERLRLQIHWITKTSHLLLTDSKT